MSINIHKDKQILLRRIPSLDGSVFELFVGLTVTLASVIVVVALPIRHEHEANI